MLANKLEYGDTIGVVGVSDSLNYNNKKELFYKAEENFIKKGFKIKRGKYVFNDYFGSAGTRHEKAEDLMNMFKDKEVKAIIFLEGGQTCNTIVDLLDYDIIKNNPKIITGFSDITVLLQTIYKKTGLVGFHGPCFVDYGEGNTERKLKEFENVFVNKQIEKFYLGNKKVIRGKEFVQGKSIGTNLGTMMYLIGTDFLPDMTNKILFIESYISSPNECQRRFEHLRQVGIFDKINAIVIGYNYSLQNDNEAIQMEDILLDYSEYYQFPIIKCNEFGHQIENSIFPIGVETLINCVDEKIDFIEEFLK